MGWLHNLYMQQQVNELIYVFKMRVLEFTILKVSAILLHSYKIFFPIPDRPSSSRHVRATETRASPASPVCWGPCPGAWASLLGPQVRKKIGEKIRRKNLINTSSGPTTGVILGWLAQHTWGYGYWGPFLLDFEVGLAGMFYHFLS